MDRLALIPTPGIQRWREFRMRLVPILSFTAALAVAVVMWDENVAAPILVGEVETVRSSIISPKSGKLSQLNVTRFQRVRTGDVIAEVITADPKILDPIKLTVPMDGTISAVYHWSGESIAAGEPIVALSSANSDRIVGYVRRPLTFQPQLPGEHVDLRILASKTPGAARASASVGVR